MHGGVKKIFYFLIMFKTFKEKVINEFLFGNMKIKIMLRMKIKIMNFSIHKYICFGKNIESKKMKKVKI
jgi:hypothetical protein